MAPGLQAVPNFQAAGHHAAGGVNATNNLEMYRLRYRIALLIIEALYSPIAPAPPQGRGRIDVRAGKSDARWELSVRLHYDPLIFQNVTMPLGMGIAPVLAATSENHGSTRGQ